MKAIRLHRSLEPIQASIRSVARFGRLRTPVRWKLGTFGVCSP
jgi:hypothetical protein